MQLLVIAAIVASVAANEETSANHKEDYKPAEKPVQPADEYHPHEYSWFVKNIPSNNDYTHQHSVDDKGFTKGSYKVLLPDGRIQIITYTADPYAGYRALVQYIEGANYVVHTHSSPAPSYVEATQATVSHKPADTKRHSGVQLSGNFRQANEVPVDSKQQFSNAVKEHVLPPVDFKVVHSTTADPKPVPAATTRRPQLRLTTELTLPHHIATLSDVATTDSSNIQNIEPLYREMMDFKLHKLKAKNKKDVRES